MRLRSTLFALALLACDGTPPTTPPATTAAFDLSSDWTQPDHFYDFPWPSDLRLVGGKPDLTGFPNPSGVPLVDALRAEAMDRPGFPVIPVAYFSFSSAIPLQDPEQTIAASASAAVLLVDVDATSSTRGRLIPLVAATPVSDNFVPDHLLALAPRPGFVLDAKHQYAFVVRRGFGDADGKPLGVPDGLAQLASGGTPSGARGAMAQALYAPLWPTLAQLGVPAADVAAATVFTTGDVVDDLAQISTALAAKYAVTVDNLHYAPEAGVVQDRFCELVGTVTMPQFQQGMQPFDKQGLFSFTDGGLPAKQGEMTIPVVINLPKQAMPVGGWPLTVFFHGSGGVYTAVVDRGPVTMVGGMDTPGRGPAYVLAAHDIATAGSALPVNPDRLAGAQELAYINFNNLPAFRDTFRQGVIEQRLYIASLKNLSIDPALVAGCDGPSLPTGETAYHFNPDQLLAQGQSMGGMYTNMVSAVEPRVKAAVPTGAGGYWSYMVLKTHLVPGAAGFLGGLLGTSNLTFLHPAMHVLEMAWEPSDPFVYMPRVARRPLAGAHARPIYEPVGFMDEYFPTEVYDAVALSYGHNEVGDAIWPTMQQALALDHLDGILPYPASNNRMSSTGEPYTGVVVQYMGDGLDDPHAIYKQLDSVKYQYGCFFETFLATGTALVPPVRALGTSCQ